MRKKIEKEVERAEKIIYRQSLHTTEAQLLKEKKRIITKNLKQAYGIFDNYFRHSNHYQTKTPK
jgi:hypothetical protein